MKYFFLLFSEAHFTARDKTQYAGSLLIMARFYPNQQQGSI